MKIPPWQVLFTLVFGSFISFSPAALSQPDDVLTTGLRNSASARASSTPKPALPRVVIEAKIIRIPGSSSFLGDRQALVASASNPVITGEMTPEQVGIILKSIVENRQGEIIYSRKFQTSSGRGITVSTTDLMTDNPKRKVDQFELWVTPVAERNAVRLFAGIPPETSNAAARLAFEAESPVPVPNNNSLLFTTRDNSEPSAAHYLIILTPSVLPKKIER